MPASTHDSMPKPASTAPVAFTRSLNLFDCSMLVVGVMIGSGIFIVPAGMARTIQSPGWLLAAWVVTGLLTVAAAACYGELSSMFPAAGGMYRYLRQAYSPFWGFLYGWTFFAVIQTGTIAAVAVAFARFTGVLLPFLSESNYLLGPRLLSSGYAVSLSTAQLLALATIAFLTAANSLGVKYGKWLQNVFTVAKIGTLAALICLGLVIGRDHEAVLRNFSQMWQLRQHGVSLPIDSWHSLAAILVAVGLAQTGSLFSADSWHNVAFASEEVRNPKRALPLSLIFGSATVVLLYLVVNIVYLTNLTLPEVQGSPHDLVATAMLERIFPSLGGKIMAVAIMVSTFGCINSLVLAGARAHYALAVDRLFPRSVAKLNRAGVPGVSLWLQAIWAGALVTVNTYSPKTGYGNLYNDLLDYIISAALLFYILAIAAVVVLRFSRPEAPRPFRTIGYPVTPVLYILGAGAIVVCLFVYRSSTTWPGLLIVATGIPIYWMMKRRRDAALG